MKPKILFLDEPVGSIKSKYLELCTQTSAYCNADIIYTHMRSIDHLAPHLEVILCPCTGIEHLENEVNNGTPVIYLDDKDFLKENIFSTAEYTIQSMLEAVRYNKDELHYTTIGLIGGAGRVGQQVIDRLEGLTNFIPLVYDIVEPTEEYRKKCIYTKSMADLIEACDLISIHIPRKGNKNYIDSTYLEYMTQNGVKYLINSSRSSVIEPEALLEYLPMFDYVKIDLTGDYPKYIVDQLKQYEDYSMVGNLRLTNHVAGSMKPSRLRTDTYIFNKFEKWWENKHSKTLKEKADILEKAMDTMHPVKFEKFLEQQDQEVIIEVAKRRKNELDPLALLILGRYL